MEEKLDARPHKLELLNREKGSVTGIQDVVSFDENQMILDTNMGLLTVRGKAPACEPSDVGKGRSGY